MFLDVIKNAFGCRRKSWLYKLLPAFLQVFLVITIWHFLKSRDSHESRNVRTTSDDGGKTAPLCSPGEYATGNKLSLGSLVAIEDEGFILRDPMQPLFLNVEIFVRDSELGTLILYPAGTPVIISRTKDSDEKVGDELVFFDDNNEEGLKGGMEEERLYAKDTSKTANQFVEDIQKDSYLVNNRLEESQVEQAQDKPNINGMLVADEMLRVRPEDQKGQQEILEALEEHDDAKEPGDTDGLQEREHAIPMYEAVNEQNQEQAFLKPSSFPIYKKKHFAQVNDQGKLLQPKKATLKSAVFDQMRNNKFIADSSTTKFFSHTFPSVTQTSKLPDTGAQGQWKAQTNNAEQSQFSAGYEDRIKKFKYEYFGRYVDASHRTGNIAIPYVLINPQRCGFPEAIDILYIINSLPQNSEQRQRIRDTFSASKFFQPRVIAYVFLLGISMIPGLQTKLKQENLMYGDVVQGDFQDTPGNASLKGLMGLRWVLQYCPQVDFVMKIDDEVFVDSDKLLNGLLPVVRKTVPQRSVLCAFNSQGPIPRVGPNSFTFDMFPNRTLLRPYCKGYAVIISRSLIQSLVEAAKHVPLLHVDDFYLYGVLPFIVGGVDVYDLGNKRAFHDFGVEAVSCYENMGDKCPYVASKAFSDRFTSLWDMLQARMSRSGGKWNSKLSLWNIPSFKRNF
ncbi:Beta-1 3-galactosyltransferase 1 [Biomphalaria glabrata]|nr:lactosylceramide 1; 3-N-acetyl-beta-D-glucosaminyltransferase B-like [Biomphalaria glabrata]